MKYTTVLCLLGAVSVAEASKITSVSSRRTPVKGVTFVETRDGSDEDSDDDEKSLVQLQWTEPWGPGEDGIVDALTEPLTTCAERLWVDPRELSWQMDMFSRTCDRKYYDNSTKIQEETIKAGRAIDLPKVNSWELLDKAFDFSRIRRYNFVNDNMDMLEHFQDNLNMNRSNLVNVENFIRVCKTVNKNFTDKYHNDEFDSPAVHDPRQEALEKYNKEIK
jgi:hypothetical protein